MIETVGKDQSLQGGDEYWVGGKRHVSFWQPAIPKPYLCRHLEEPVRAVIGFWRTDTVSVADMAAMSGLLPGEFIAMNRLLVSSDNMAVHFAKRFGLPASASVTLLRAFRCKGCGGTIIRLPCIRCWKGPDDDPHL